MPSNAPEGGPPDRVGEIRDALAAAVARAGENADHPPGGPSSDLTSMEYDVLRAAASEAGSLAVTIEARCLVLRAGFDLIADARGRGGRVVSYREFQGGMRLPDALFEEPALKDAMRVVGEIGGATGAGAVRAAVRAAAARYLSASTNDRLVLLATLTQVAAASFRTMTSTALPLSAIAVKVAAALEVDWP